MPPDTTLRKPLKSTDDRLSSKQNEHDVLLIRYWSPREEHPRNILRMVHGTQTTRVTQERR
jgi:hypothetical protein